MPVLKSKMIQPTHFAVVATGHGEWVKSTDLGIALENIKKRLGKQRLEPGSLTVFASTATMDLEFDAVVRAYPQPGHDLIKFNI